MFGPPHFSALPFPKIRENIEAPVDKKSLKFFDGLVDKVDGNNEEVWEIRDVSRCALKKCIC